MSNIMLPEKMNSKDLNSKHTPLTVAEAILSQLRLWGVKRIYGVVGDAIFGLMDALAKQEDISFISVKHESVASMMASAEAKLTGQLAVCISQMGPGLAKRSRLGLYSLLLYSKMNTQEFRTYKLDFREFKFVGIRHSGLFSEYSTIVVETIPTLRNRMAEYSSGPIRRSSYMCRNAATIMMRGIFIRRYLVKKSVTDIPVGMEFFHLSGQYVSLCGNESKMGELYNFLDGLAKVDIKRIGRPLHHRSL